jgi:hypothetical protein
VKQRVLIAALTGLAVGYLWLAVGCAVSNRTDGTPAWDYILTMWLAAAIVTCPVVLLIPAAWTVAWLTGWFNALLYGLVAAACRGRIRNVLAAVGVAVLFATATVAYFQAPFLTPIPPRARTFVLDHYLAIAAVLAAVGGAATRTWSSALPTLTGAAAGVFVGFGVDLMPGNNGQFCTLLVWETERLHLAAAALLAGAGWLSVELALTWVKQRARQTV